MKLLSIIIPIYNVEGYVERCILSLADQDIAPDEYEIICINDGSPDRSRDIVRKMQEKYKNIILIDQDNQGVSCARNNGIDTATGNYLLFVDPDDFIEPGSLKHVIETADYYKCQVSFLGFTILSEEGKVRRRVLNSKNKGKIYEGTEAYYISRGDGQNDPDRMWAVLFRRDFINIHGLRYLSGVPFLEDGELITRILCLADRCIFDGHQFYNRTIRTGSATNSSLFNSEKAVNGFLRAACNLRTFRNNQVLQKEKRDFLNQPICKFVVLVITASARPFKIRRIRNTKRRLCEEGFCKLNIKSTDIEYKILGLLYNSSVYALVSYQIIIFSIRHIRSLISNLIR